MVVSDGWYISDTVFPVRLFDVVTFEGFIWTFLLVYLIVMFYEYFIDREPRRVKIIDKRMVYFMACLLFLLSVMTLILVINPDWLKLPYPYLLIGIFFAIIPLTLFLRRFPHLFVKFAKATGYFFFLALMVEWTGLELGQWVFPGTHFIGWVSLWHYTIPFEEFFFYFILLAPGILTYYEFFDDDRK